jgi:hypothetical protein
MILLQQIYKAAWEEEDYHFDHWNGRMECSTTFASSIEFAHIVVVEIPVAIKQQQSVCNHRQERN